MAVRGADSADLGRGEPGLRLGVTLNATIKCEVGHRVGANLHR